MQKAGQSMGRTEYVAPPQSTSQTDWVILGRWSLIWTNFPTPEVGRDQNLNPRLQLIVWHHNYAWNQERILEVRSLCAYRGFYFSIRNINDFLWFRKLLQVACSSLMLVYGTMTRKYPIMFSLKFWVLRTECKQVVRIWHLKHKYFLAWFLATKVS